MNSISGQRLVRRDSVKNNYSRVLRDANYKFVQFQGQTYLVFDTKEEAAAYYALISRSVICELHGASIRL